MNDETMRIPNRPATNAVAKPNNLLLVVGTFLVALAAMAVLLWMGDPTLTHAQSALIAALVLSLGAASALICHGVRIWIHAAESRIVRLVQLVESRIVQLIDENAGSARCQHYDLSGNIAGTSAELEALKALVGDFIKRYPPVGDQQHPDVAELAETVRSVGRIVVGIARQRDTVDQEAEWFTEAVDLGRRLEAEEHRRKGGSAPV